MKCMDHLGKEYPSKTAMCQKYKIPRELFFSRINQGWGLKEALTTPVMTGRGRGGQTSDHLGNTFRSEKEMCWFHKVNYTTYRMRKKRGMSLSECLSVENKHHSGCHDHLGNYFSSLKEMTEYYGLSMNVYYDRIAKWSLEKTLTTPLRSISKPCKDYLGNEFDSIGQMCLFYGITHSQYLKRKEAGWSLQAILTAPHAKEKGISYNGVKYSSVRDFLKTMPFSEASYLRWEKEGLSIEQMVERAKTEGYNNPGPICVGEKNLMPCKMQAKVVEVNDRGRITVVFEDGVIKENQEMYLFRLGRISHPSFTFRKERRPYRNMKVKYAVKTEDGTPYYGCTCRCGFKGILTPVQAASHVCPEGKKL